MKGKADPEKVSLNEAGRDFLTQNRG